eukprot:GHVU01041130.1.p3 GENE.GHVU01041130.1~~GHVU01041130.1.p3  ORF type:complete len:127 (-),score=19.57 GHVU01041130.1:14-394(-)
MYVCAYVSVCVYVCARVCTCVYVCARGVTCVIVSHPCSRAVFSPPLFFLLLLLLLFLPPPLLLILLIQANIEAFAKQVHGMYHQRVNLGAYLEGRLHFVAPYLQAPDILAARLISDAGDGKHVRGS